MPTKKPIKSRVRTSAKAGSKAAKSKKIKITLGIIGLVVALVGGLVIYRSFACGNEGFRALACRMQQNLGLRNAGNAINSGNSPGAALDRTANGTYKDGFWKENSGGSGSGGSGSGSGGSDSGSGSGGNGKSKNCQYGKYRNGSCKPKPSSGSNNRRPGNSAPVIPNCKWNQSIKENNPNCQPPWPPEVALAESNQWTPVPMYLAYPSKETTSTTAVDLSSGPNGMNNWNVGPKYDTPGNISGAVAFNDMKDQRYWYTSSGMAAGQARPYANVLICAEASGIGTIKINVANTDNKQETIASFNVNQASRTFCGAYPQSKITNFSVAAESRLGYPVKINKVSMKLLLQ